MLKSIVLGVAFLLVGVGTMSSAKADIYRGDDPAKMMTLKDVDILGVNLTMTMGEILAKLRAQGLNPVCKGLICQVRADGYKLNIQHSLKSLGMRAHHIPVDESKTPVSIGLAENMDMSKCGPVKDMIETYCNKDEKKQPCFTNNQNRINGNFSASGKSADGYLYSGTVALWPGQLCNMSVMRQK